MSSSRKFNPRQFVGDLIKGAEAAKNIDAAEFGAILIGALVNQLGPEAAALMKVAPKKKRAARRSKTTDRTRAGAGEGTGQSANGEARTGTGA